ncbi:signal peptide peptidase SppA [Ancylobacter defluvii]|uniref:Protease n=1 Tax=Ancylobacter defluvii TaxID=1282440 RepID=A0A9W6NA43_9HYPH|nr:signal peptide peptidase SppA [Ancylobacter defluvii]MBS7590286.1 signal peptide peptidase SppA [Ancylobacter defluvii]GLK83200.1 protease [Ancylobacter defluvii]
MLGTAMDVDSLLERRRLRRKLTFWRVALLLVIAGAAALAAVWWTDGGFTPRSAPHVARVSIGGIIRNDRERLEMFDDIARSGARAVIIAIDSPGGTVVGSQQLYDGLRRLAEKLPVVAVVDGMAASGAYIAAMGADHIVAPRNAMVGSIGVIFQYPNFTDLMKTVGVAYETIKSSPLKAVPNGFEPTSLEARAAVMSLVTDSYDWFRGLVAERRTIAGEKLDLVADGRVFTAHQGLPLNLVDELGDERTARAYLARERDVAESLPVRVWRTGRSGEEFGWLRAAGVRLMSLFGLGDVASVLIGPAFDAATQSRLDGLLALWHPRD